MLLSQRRPKQQASTESTTSTEQSHNNQTTSSTTNNTSSSSAKSQMFKGTKESKTVLWIFGALVVITLCELAILYTNSTPSFVFASSINNNVVTNNNNKNIPNVDILVDSGNGNDRKTISEIKNSKFQSKDTENLQDAASIPNDEKNQLVDNESSNQLNSDEKKTIVKRQDVEEPENFENNENNEQQQPQEDEEEVNDENAGYLDEWEGIDPEFEMTTEKDMYTQFIESYEQISDEWILPVDELVLGPKLSSGGFGRTYIGKKNEIFSTNMSSFLFILLLAWIWGTQIVVKKFRSRVRVGSIYREMALHARVRHPNVVQCMFLHAFLFVVFPF